MAEIPADNSVRRRATPRAIPVRAPRFSLEAAEVPRAWLGGSVLSSHVVNALSLLFPEGERFFIRAVKHYLPAIEDDPGLRERVRGFFGQEGRHGHEHDRLNDLLAAHGYDIERFLRFYQRLAYSVIEPATPPHVRLSTTVALEHMTATLAEVALTTGVLENAHPEVRRLLFWHAAEEIEHRSVAFDVLSRVDPRMRTRVLGLGMASAILALFWSTALLMLLEDERALPRGADDARAGRHFAREVKKAGPIVGRALASYLRRDFHPEAGLAQELAVRALAVAGVAP